MNWVVVDDVFTTEELDTMCEYFDTHAKLQSAATPTNSGKWRISDVSFFERNDQEIKWIFQKLDKKIMDVNKSAFHYKLNGYNEFQYAVYNQNGQYKFHPDIASGQLGIRKLSASLLLNDFGVDYEGGEFLFNMGNENKPHTIPLKRGSMVLFPSYLLHAVSPVTKGTRKSLVVWVEGPNFT